MYNIYVKILCFWSIVGLFFGIWQGYKNKLINNIYTFFLCGLLGTVFAPLFILWIALVVFMFAFLFV